MMPGSGLPTAMFLVRASTMPAPATVLLNGERAGSIGGGGLGSVCCAFTTWMTAKVNMPTAIRGSKKGLMRFHIFHLNVC